MCRSPRAVSCASTLALIVMIVQAQGAYATSTGPGEPVAIALSRSVLQALIVGSVSFFLIIVLACAVLYHAAKGRRGKQANREKQHL